MKAGLSKEALVAIIERMHAYRVQSSADTLMAMMHQAERLDELAKKYNVAIVPNRP